MTLYFYAIDSNEVTMGWAYSSDEGDIYTVTWCENLADFFLYFTQ
jgi:hypothetical protein